MTGFYRWAAVVAVLGAGCAGDKSPPIAPVSGKLTLNGKPLAKTRVDFIPEEATGEKFLRSTGVTDEQGQFTLLCDNGKPGAVVGWHKVVLGPGDHGGRADDNPHGGRDDRGQASSGGRGQLPAALAGYANLATTPERREVKPGDNVIEINITK